MCDPRDLPPLPPAGGQVRVAILSDTHGGVDPRVQEVVADCDLAVHGGDIGNAQVLSQLQPRKGRVLAVYGNNDTIRHWPAEDQDLLRLLPEWLGYPLPGGHLIVIHGHQSNARNRHQWLRRRFPGARALVYGHSHQLIVDTGETPWVLNPGAAGRVRTHGGPSCLVLVASDTEWTVEIHRFSYPSRHHAAHRGHVRDHKTESP